MSDTWLQTFLEEIAQFGAGERGMDRLAFTEADRQARQYVTDIMTELGMSVREDAFGNLIGRLEGSDPQAAPVATGSHIDTVPDGGKYDGIAGVAASLYAVKQLRQRGPLTHPLEIIVFMAEESSRFGFATMGSKAMSGQVNQSLWAKAADKDGVTLAEAMRSFGLDLSAVKAAIRQPGELKAFVELHIEQGPVLEATGKKIGVVTAIAAPTRLKITVKGFAAHSGTTPMEDRQDALVSAAMIVLAIQEIALEQSRHGTVGTVGNLKVHPGVMNVVPGLVEMWVDIRGVNHGSIIECLQDVKDAISTIAEGQGTPVAIDILTSDKPVELDEGVRSVITEAARTCGASYQDIHSGAGHDAMNMASLAPTGMIFIPCRQGISHNPEEFAAPEDIQTGADVLTETLYQLAK
ncbi:MAG: Zn-dependent hydrolase [Sporomusaceae bacterium]|nr:Zn-dependent hydrolase [Sporomusaceae bacterium]